LPGHLFILGNHRKLNNSLIFDKCRVVTGTFVGDVFISPSLLIFTLDGVMRVGNKIKNVTRYIKRNVERELWARSAGRCEFAGCNKPLYKSPITQERVNISEKAHIYSFSQNGPRGWGPFIINRNELNDISNLILMCHDCHETIDQDKEGIRYTPELLINWKNEHEQKVMIVTGISPHKKSHVVLYGANIGQEKSPLCHIEAVEAMFPDKFPAEEKSIDLSMRCEHEDNSRDFWETEKTNLKTLFQRQIEFRIRENNPSHFSLFALAPQPLLIQLGTLFTDKIDVDGETAPRFSFG
jgi:hypothetical protein